MTRKSATIFLEDGNCRAAVMLHDNPAEDFWKDGITEKNIAELVKIITKLGYHVTLFRVAKPEFFIGIGTCECPDYVEWRGVCSQCGLKR